MVLRNRRSVAAAQAMRALLCAESRGTALGRETFKSFRKRVVVQRDEVTVTRAAIPRFKRDAKLAPPDTQITARIHQFRNALYAATLSEFLFVAL